MFAAMAQQPKGGKRVAKRPAGNVKSLFENMAREAAPAEKRQRRGRTEIFKYNHVSDVFQISQLLADAMSQTGRERTLQSGIESHSSIYMTSSFSGAGFGEIGIEAMASALGIKLVYGRAIEWDSKCAKVLMGSHTTRCIFSDISDFVLELDPEADGVTTAAKAKKFPSKCWCWRHERECPVRPTNAFLRLECAGPPCPPWSKFSRSRKGTEDPRFEHHKVPWLDLVFSFISSFGFV